MRDSSLSQIRKLRRAGRYQRSGHTQIDFAAEPVRNPVNLRLAVRKFHRALPSFLSARAITRGGSARSVRSFCQRTKSFAVFSHNFTAKLQLFLKSWIIRSEQIAFGGLNSEQSIAGLDFQAVQR